jgi:hypothetical protein
MFGRLMVLGRHGRAALSVPAGVAAALAASSEIDRGRSAREAARRVERRGWQIFLLAFLFRLQSFVLGGFTRPATLLKVDILNIMGPAIASTAALWGSVSTRRARAVLLTTATLLLLAISPWIRNTPLLATLPDPIEWYIRPAAGQGYLHDLPWAGFALAGGVLGVALDGARSAGWPAWRLPASIAVTGLALVLLGDWGGPSADPDSGGHLLGDVAGVLRDPDRPDSVACVRGVDVVGAAVAPDGRRQPAGDAGGRLPVRILGARGVGVRLCYSTLAASPDARAVRRGVGRLLTGDVCVTAELERFPTDTALAARGSRKALQIRQLDPDTARQP